MVNKYVTFCEIISPNLNPDGGVGRTQKQKVLKQFVIVGSRLKPFVFQIHFKRLPSLTFSNIATLTHGCIFLEEVIINLSCIYRLSL